MRGGNTQFKLGSKIVVFFGIDGRWRSVGEMMWKVMGECLCNLSPSYDWCPLWELQWSLQSDIHQPVIHLVFSNTLSFIRPVMRPVRLLCLVSHWLPQESSVCCLWGRCLRYCHWGLYCCSPLASVRDAANTTFSRHDRVRDPLARKHAIFL